MQNLSNPADFLDRLLEKNGYAVDTEKTKKYVSYIDLLTRWNKAFNLTSIRDPLDMMTLHIADSLSIHPYLHGDHIADIGTGAGLPGIPLAIFYPHMQFTLLDSNHKKTRFVTQAVHELKLPNVAVIHARTEEYRPETLFSSVVSRAFASIQVMLETTEHLIQPDGQFLAMKGNYPTEEIKGIPPRFSLNSVHPLTIHGLDAARHLVCITQESSWQK